MQSELKASECNNKMLNPYIVFPKGIPMKNKKYCLLFTIHCLLFYLFFITSVYGDTTLQDASHKTTGDNPLYTVRDSVLSYFYPATGTITEIKDRVVVVRFQTTQRLRQGMRFSVLREGEPFYHPVTKEQLGKLEVFIGKIEIKGITDGEYSCTVVKGTREVGIDSYRVGDIVRITSSRVRLAFFQHRKADWRLSEVFYNSVKESGRFNIIEAYSNTYESKELAETGRAHGAEAILMLSTPLRNGAISLNVKLLWADDAEMFAEIEEPIGADLLTALKSKEELIPIIPPKGEPWRSHELLGGQLIAMGDVDGNGRRELVVSDGNSIKIYDYKEEPKEIWFIKGSASEEHLSIDVLDVNNNGIAEIFVTSMKGENTMSSYVLEYSPSQGEYRKIWDKAPYFFRVTRGRLLMQAFNRFEIYSGSVYDVEWKDRIYQKGKPVKLPQGVDIYGFTFIDWQGKGVSQVLSFDSKGYLNLYDEGQLIWSSKDSYGGFNISFERSTLSVVNPQEKWFVKGRLIAIKTQRGEKVIVVKKIPVLEKVPRLGYKSADVYALWWDGSIMDESLILQSPSGAITDYWMDGRNLFLIARTGLTGLLTKALSGDFSRGSTLYYYQFEE